MKKFKKISIVVSILLIIMLNLVGCSKGEESENVVKEYTKVWNEGNYEKMYEMLSKKSKEYISKDIFIKRYSDIYLAMGVNDIKVKLDEIKNISEIPMSVSMNTIAGNLKFDDFRFNLVKEDNTYKIVWDENLILPQMINKDKIRVKTIKASRGKILDRDGNSLAYDGEVNSVYIYPKIFEENKEENISKMSQILDISEEYIQKKLDKNENPDYLVSIVRISNYEQEKANLVDKISGVDIKSENSRVYIQGEAFGNLIGYIGDITKEELDENKGRGYNAYSKIGRNGLEKIYEEKLRARDGVHIYIERGEEEINIAKTKPINGEDIKLGIDSKLQEQTYAQMNNDKGASIAIHPKTGEVLAMVSSPSYDSNTLVTYKTKTIVQKWEESENAQFQNRANDVYSPGSTMKLLTAAIGLESELINPNETMDIKGLTWQKDSSWGDYKITRVKDSNKPVNLYDAIKYSDNIYFADKAIKIGKEKYIEGCSKFGIGKEVPFEYPMQTSQISNDKKLEDEVLLADTGYGQGQVLMSPLDVAMSYSILGNEGKIMKPRLVISENSEPKIYKEVIDKKYMPELIKSFSSVINDEDGSGNLAKIEGINLAGKTGTAEIKSSKDDKDGSENGWFVAINTDEPKIVMSMIIEDIKDKNGSAYVVSKVRNSIESYLKK
jgi:penicillin-binding protein